MLALYVSPFISNLTQHHLNESDCISLLYNAHHCYNSLSYLLTDFLPQLIVGITNVLQSIFLYYAVAYVDHYFTDQLMGAIMGTAVVGVIGLGLFFFSPLQKEEEGKQTEENAKNKKQQ
jgi:hypothetical protein